MNLRRSLSNSFLPKRKVFVFLFVISLCLFPLIVITTIGATEREKRKPAWVDQDDEEVQVNVVKNKRLRSLRKNETETVISGVEYAQRLREL